MKCCEKCFVDEEIKKLFNNVESLGECEVCKAKQVKILEVKDERLKDYFGALLDVYTPIEKDSDYGEAKGDLIKNILKEDWHIFNSKLEPDKVEKFLREIFPEKNAFFNQKITIMFI